MSEIPNLLNVTPPSPLHTTAPAQLSERRAKSPEKWTWIPEYPRTPSLPPPDTIRSARTLQVLNFDLKRLLLIYSPSQTVLSMLWSFTLYQYCFCCHRVLLHIKCCQNYWSWHKLINGIQQCEMCPCSLLCNQYFVFSKVKVVSCARPL